MKSLRWRFLLVALVTLWGLYTVAPSIIYFASPKDVRNSPEEMAKRIPDWLPQKHVSLGLDLQGGVQLVLGVNTDNAVDNKLARIGTETQRWSDDTNQGVAKAYALEGRQMLRVELKDGTDANTFRDKFRTEFPGFVQKNKEGNVLDFALDEDQVKRIKQSATEQAEKVVRNRVDKWGVSEPQISRRQVDNSILVQLPGFKDPGRAKELLGRTAQLKFKLVDDQFQGFKNLAGQLPPGITLTSNGGQSALQSEDRDALAAYVKDKIPADRQVYFQRESLAGGKKARFTTYVVDAATELGGEDVLDAFVSQNSQGFDNHPEVSMRFTGPGGKRFGDITGANIGKRLAIVLDDTVESAPVIQSKIPTGEARITLGNSSNYQDLYKQANELSLILKSGALPATITVLEERQVGATLGPELADQGIKAALLGLFAVLVYMVAYYRRPGLIACAALVLNGLFLLALMANLGFSLSLPGIAGFILTLGMAVDANVLINERIREELGAGKTPKKALENGFSRVFWTIFDANVTSLIAALVLLETNPAGPVRGFAVTLVIGLLVSMFTAMFCSRVFFDGAMARCKTDKAMRLWLGGSLAKPKVFNFNFMKYGKMFTAIGGGMVVLVIAVAAIRGVNWGVDFSGGTEMQVAFAQPTTQAEIEQAANKAGLKSITLQGVGDSGKEYLLRFGGEDFDTQGKTLTAAEESARVQEFKTTFAQNIASKGPEIRSIDFVGPQIGKELRNQGVVSMAYAIIGILLYIALRFDMRFGPGAVAKMVHDLFAMLAFYVIFNRNFDLTSVAAALTVIGYSINDVVVIYDRIRENLAIHTKKPMVEIVNLSLNETLIRSVNTSVATLVSLLGILIFATGSLWNFAAAMAVGVVAATHSSTFIASTFMLFTEKFKFPSAKGAKDSKPAQSAAAARS